MPHRNGEVKVFQDTSVIMAHESKGKSPPPPSISSAPVVPPPTAVALNNERNTSPPMLIKNTTNGGNHQEVEEEVRRATIKHTQSTGDAFLDIMQNGGGITSGIGNSPLDFSTTPVKNTFPSCDPAIMTKLSEFTSYTNGLRDNNFNESEVNRPKKIYRVVLTGGTYILYYYMHGKWIDYRLVDKLKVTSTILYYRFSLLPTQTSSQPQLKSS
jgi:hypothetical protein